MTIPSNFKICSICGKKYTEYGNTAEPINSGRCCDFCDHTKVIPARIKEYMARRRNK